MTNQTVVEELEGLAAAIAEKSQVDFKKDGGVVGGNIIERGLDSLDLVDYLLAIEEKYGCRVSEDQIQAGKLLSTSNMAQFLEKRLRSGSSPS